MMLILVNKTQGSDTVEERQLNKELRARKENRSTQPADSARSKNK